MMSKDKNLLHFPSVLNVGPGGKSEVLPVEDPETPDWKREVARKVMEHQRRKKAREEIESLQKLDRPASPPPQEFVSTAKTLENDEVLAIQKKLLAERNAPRSAPPPEPPPPEPSAPPAPPPAPPAPATAQTPASLATTIAEGVMASHQETLRQLDAPPVGETGSDDRTFDQITLKKAHTLSGTELELPVADEHEEELTREEYTLSLDQVLERRKNNPVVRRPALGIDRTILLSRMLAGLIDLLLVLTLSVSFLLTVAFFMAAPVFAPRMGWLLIGLFVMALYTYGLFFLCTSGQTIGMVIVGLQVAYRGGTRLTPTAALVRISAFLFAIVCFFLGLVWGLFDSEARCWQDILSDSRVIRT